MGNIGRGEKCKSDRERRNRAEDGKKEKEKKNEIRERKGEWKQGGWESERQARREGGRKSGRGYYYKASGVFFRVICSRFYSASCGVNLEDGVG